MHRRRGSGSASGDEPTSAARRYAGWSAAIGGLVCMAAVGDALCDNWTYSASAGAAETYNHYIGADQPSDGFVTSLTAALGIHGQGARFSLNGNVGATEEIYTGQGESNSFAPSVTLAANLEAIEKFFYIDATANVSESFVSPFGPQPANLTTPSNNRYVSESYSVSPYIKGVIAPDITYSLRDDNVWTPSSSYGNSSAKVPTTYLNSLNGQMNSPTAPWGWTLQYSAEDYDNGISSDRYIVQVGRAIISYSVDPQLTVSGRVGYESDRFADSPTINGAIYGFGVNWQPTDRTAVNGFWEHQFFGSSYSWQVSHRLPNVALSANFSRGLSSYPQNALLIPAGVNVAQYLDAAFATRIPDPAQRAAAVAQFLAENGLPPTLISPLNFYATTITLQQTETLTAVWVGKLNTVAFTLFRVESQQVTGQGTQPVPSPVQFGANNTQTGGGVTYSRPVTAFTSFVASATYTTTTPTGSTDQTLGNVRTKNYNASVALSTQLTRKTNGSVGVTYFLFDTPGSGSVPSTSIARQASVGVYASVTHTF
jgi:uncharacterized protein (PEP-CTERM system associated)